MTTAERRRYNRLRKLLTTLERTEDLLEASPEDLADRADFAETLDRTRQNIQTVKAQLLELAGLAAEPHGTIATAN